MRKLFNHTRKSRDNRDIYDENNYDWDEAEQYEMNEAESYQDENGEYCAAEGEYYEEGTEGVEYYEEAPEGIGYYAEGAEGAEYYAEGAEEAEYYTEGAEGAAYYEEAPVGVEYYEEGVEGTVYYEDGNGEYYAEEGEYYAGEEGEYYADSEEAVWYEEEPSVEERASRPSNTDRNSRHQKNFFLGLWGKFLEMAVMDRVITATGIAVLILALVTGGVYVGSRAIDDEVSALAGVGSQLSGIELIGEKGLMAVADAEMARQEAAEIVVEEEEEPKEYDEEEYSNTVTVKLNMTSVKKDLKIKFTNKKTGKLIGNVPFSVTITKPDGKSDTWSDDDMDGIIYKKNIDAGTYKVLVNELTSEKYKDYTIPSAAQSVEVKKDIAYEKIDVSDEVKTESEIDASKEDTKINETVVESTLQDTVAWVESTAVAETYTEVSKTTIPDPATLTFAMSETFLRMAAAPDVSVTVSGGDSEPKEENVAFKVSIDPTETALAIGDTAKAKVTASEYTKGKTLVYSIVSNNEAVATAQIDQSGNIIVTGMAAGTATITATVNYAEGTSMPVTATLKVTVKDKPIITLDQATATVYTTETVVLNATVINALTDTAVVAESSDTAVATVEVADKVITVTGVAEGDATITIKYVENEQETLATCVVKVVLHPKDNTTEKLKDSKGNQLFVQDNEKYREAVYADYYTADKFFIKGDVKYTGWQTIDGNVYYFTAAGEKVTGEQVIQGAKYNFASDGSLITGSGTLGIDVSKWNGNIDWNAVKNSGISYVIIRCGYRGSSKGMLVQDPKFEANIKGAINAGLKVGVYFFTQAIDEIEAVEEASFVLDQIKNYKISYPVFLDVEPSGGRGDKIDKTTRTAVCKAFCETIQRGGYTAGIYANKTWLNEKIDTASLSAYKIWLAQYAATPTYTGRYDMWQYTSTGKVSGIKGNVDLNLSYLGY